MPSLAYFYWDPSPEVFSFSLPILGRPLMWYGVFFALGIILAYQFLHYLLKKDNSPAQKMIEQMTTYLLVGMILGSKFFDLLFYQGWSILSHRPVAILSFWEGGLSSHGGVIGILIALWLYHYKNRQFNLLYLLDHLSAVAGLSAACIRIGNFFNQEILGTKTAVSWAVVFGHPLDGSYPAARHPVQLYEAFFYLILFGVMIKLLNLKKSGKRLQNDGALCGIFFITLFSFRFFIEFFKEEQSTFLSSSMLTMGQLLSIPLVILGWLLLKGKTSAIQKADL